MIKRPLRASSAKSLIDVFRRNVSVRAVFVGSMTLVEDRKINACCLPCPFPAESVKEATIASAKKRSCDLVDKT
jgi:hypothetical protein